MNYNNTNSMSGDIKYNTKELRKINIENLFSTTTHNSHTSGKMDINTLFSHKSKNNKPSFDPKLLLNGGIKRKNMLDKCYINIYDACCDTILMADKAGVTDIVFEVPIAENCVGYNTEESITILEKNLKKVSNNGIQCQPITKTKLFITWHNIEKALSSKDVNNDNDDYSD